MHSPDFIYDIAVARCASEFLSSELALETFAEKYAQGLTELYSEFDLHAIQDPAEQHLQFLAEIEAGEAAVDLLSGFVHFRRSGNPKGKHTLWPALPPASPS